MNPVRTQKTDTNQFSVESSYFTTVIQQTIKLSEF